MNDEKVHEWGTRHLRASPEGEVGFSPLSQPSVRERGFSPGPPASIATNKFQGQRAALSQPRATPRGRSYQMPTRGDESTRR